MSYLTIQAMLIVHLNLASQYLEQNGTLPVVSDVEYHLLSGEHHVPSHTILSGLYNFSLVGTTDKVSPAVIVSCLQSYIHIHDSEYVVITNLVFRNCKMPLSEQRKYEYETNLLISLCFSCQIVNATFLDMAYWDII